MKATDNNVFIAFLSSLLYVTSRFSYYNILQVYGILELVSLLFLLFIIHNSMEYIRSQESKYLVWVSFFYFSIVFTHERYIVLLPFLFFLVFLFDQSEKKIKKIMLLSIVCLPFVINYFLKTVIFKVPFLRRAAHFPIDFNIVSILKNMWFGFLKVVGINNGPEYLNLISFSAESMRIKILSIVIVLIIFSILFSTIFQIFVLSQTQKKKAIKLIFLWTVLFLSLLFSASIAFIQEQRWVFSAFVVFLIALSSLVSKVSLGQNKGIRYFLFTIFFLLMLNNDIYYKKFLSNLYFVSANKIADSFYDETIKRFGTNIMSYTIYVEKFRDYEWILQDKLFFKPYVGENYKQFKINHINNIKDIDKQELKNNKTIVYKLDWNKQRIINVSDYWYLRPIDTAIIKFDFVKNFNRGEINSKQKVATPTGLGVLTMNREQIDTLTIVSGFTFTYPQITLTGKEKITFMAALANDDSDGARFFIEIMDRKGKKRIFARDLFPNKHMREPADFFEVPLREYIGTTISISFGVESPNGNAWADWVDFYQPLIVVGE